MLIPFIKKFIYLAIMAATIGFAYHYVKSKNLPVTAPTTNPAGQIQNSTDTVQNAKDVVNADQNYGDKVKSTIQNQIGQ